MTMFQNLNRSMTGGETLKIACEVCPHRVSWTRTEAIARLGPEATPYDLRRRLTCGVCGAPRPRVSI
jgi:hypothetical protein